MGMAAVPTIRVCERRSKLRTTSRWRTTLPVPPQLGQSDIFAPWQVGQTRLPLTHVQSTSPLIQSGQGIVTPLLAGSVSIGLGMGTPCWRIPSKTSENLLPTELTTFSACRWKKGFFFSVDQSAT